MTRVTVYAASVLPLEDERLFNAAYGSVSAERRSKTDKFRMAKDKMLSLGAGVLLDYALRCAGCNNKNIIYKGNGKPYLESGEKFFSISHSGSFAVCAISDCEVGCDIEKIEPADLKIAKRFFTPGEYDSIMKESSDEAKTEAFYEYWTLKESFMKATALGMKLSLGDFEIVRQNEISVIQSVDGRSYSFCLPDGIEGFKCAVCSAGENCKADLRIIDIAEILK